jgi:hypothetical protein
LVVVLAAGAVAAPGPSGVRGGYEEPTPDPTVAPTATATPTPTPTVTPPPPDQTAPSVNSRAARGQTARSILRRGLRLNVQCNEDCRHVTTLFVSRSQARKLAINRRARRRVAVGRRTTLLKAGVAQNITVRLNRRAQRGIRRMRRARVRKLRLTIATAATDAANNVQRSSTTLSFKR